VNDKFEAAFAAAMSREHDRAVRDTLFGGIVTNTVATEPEPFTLAKAHAMLKDMQRMERLIRRSSLSIEVDAGHPGPLLMRETPNDGWIVECSPIQASHIHEHIPLKLVEVLDENRATFRPVSTVFPEFTSRWLPMPPYKLPC
jgi:hypothetical protein